jgi:hypothetical protein
MLMKATRQFFLKALRFLFIAHLLWWIDQGVGNAAAASTAAHWVGGSGNWSDPSKWDTGVVPNNAGGNTYLVTIDVADADVVVTVNQAITVSGLSNAETVRIESGGNLLLSGSVTNVGTLTAAGGTLRLSGATVANAGHVLVADGGVVVLENSTVNGGVLRVTDKDQSVVQFSGDVTLNGVPWEDLGAGRFEVVGKPTRLLGDYGHQLPAGYVLNVIWSAQWVLGGGVYERGAD